METALDEVSMELTTVMSALQFQDITSQQIEATHAVLADLGGGLSSLVGQLGIEVEEAGIVVKEGTYDARASFDRQRAADSQAEIDRLIEGGEDAAEEAMEMAASAEEMAEPVEESVEEEEAEVEAKGGNGQVDEGGGGDEVVSQDDIDALIDG